jgi:hypothetical protein
MRIILGVAVGVMSAVLPNPIKRRSLGCSCTEDDQCSSYRRCGDECFVGEITMEA